MSPQQFYVAQGMIQEQSRFQENPIARQDSLHRYCVLDCTKSVPIASSPTPLRFYLADLNQFLVNLGWSLPDGVGTFIRPSSSASKHFTPSSMAATSASSNGVR